MRWNLWISFGLVASVIIYVAAIAMHWPFTQRAVVDVLQQRSLRTVTIGHFYRTHFPPGCTAEDIRFLHRQHKEKEPLIKVQTLVLVTSYSRILTLQERLSLVRIINMHVQVPPSTSGQPNPIMPLTYSKSAASIKIDRIIADGAILDFLSTTGKKPYRLIVDKLRLDGIGNNLPMLYKTLISNQMPPGKIRSSGVFGTWNVRNPGSTPLQGNYTFDNGNLAAFGGISGRLGSSGSFKGTLRDIGVQGTADVPDFKVYDTSHARSLVVAYRANVNGTNGDTQLVDIPPGPAPFLRRLKIVGDFGVAQGKFASTKAESDLTRLSNSSQKHQKDESDRPSSNVLSHLKGHGSAVDGVATLSNVSFTIPGVAARIRGTYGLIDYKVDLHGTLLTSGNPSQATTGFKSLMVKVITPFLKKEHSQKLVPFKITGSYSKIDTSLDLHTASKQQAMKPDRSESR
jgi:hypothetical protein